MKIPFIKIDNAGNDYIYVSARTVSRVKSIPDLARAISDRNSGAGSDGLITVKSINATTAGISIYNSDGSIAELCGNGLRGTVLYLKKEFGRSGRKYSISTKWNEYSVDVIGSKKATAVIGADLGNPLFDADSIGYLGTERNCMRVSVKTSGGIRTAHCIAMPNPHAVIFVDNFDFDWQKEGGEIETNRLFKRGINVMYAKIETKNKITMRPWERGSGATRSCGSGAAAVGVAANLLGLANREVQISMPGGVISTKYDIGENSVYQSGPSRVAFTGIFEN